MNRIGFPDRLQRRGKIDFVGGWAAEDRVGGGTYPDEA